MPEQELIKIIKSVGDSYLCNQDRKHRRAQSREAAQGKQNQEERLPRKGSLYTIRDEAIEAFGPRHSKQKFSGIDKINGGRVNTRDVGKTNVDRHPFQPSDIFLIVVRPPPSKIQN
uniref:Uncharacterized protein n=1 Tax=Glossina palpalis gambiensis TaxID=67801 RepID=A0A1B0BUA7_9MUSC